MKISLKKHWVRTDAWRGYEQPIHAACGANDTGMWSDSPCRSDVCLAELKKAGSILRKNHIPYKKTWCRSSNVFCIHWYLVVPEDMVARAKELIEPIISGCNLLYIA